MILECPHCNARLNAATAPEPGKPVRCSKCKQIFHPIPAEETSQELTAGDESDWSNVASSPPTEREEPARPNRRPQQTQKKFPYIAVGGGAVAFIALAVVVGVFAFGGKTKPTSPDTNTANQQPTPPKKDNTPKKDLKTDTPSSGKPPQIPAEFVELFRESADRAAPVVLVPTLKKIGMEDLKVPSFPAKNDVDPNAGKLTLEELKRATTFMKVSSDGTAGTGSGFVIKSDDKGILVATNFHVVSLKSTTGKMPPNAKTSVVFDSGLPTQRSLRAEVVAFDPEADLAVVRVAPIDPLPKAIDAALSPKLVETMNIRSFGFPLGFSLSVDGQNPNVTVGSGTVSSVRLNAAGVVSTVQINGASLNPGNSGGPVVDSDGRLVGIVVSGIQGSGIANAIPAHKLAAMLTGRVFPPTIVMAGEEDGELTFQVDAPISDPLRKIKEINLYLAKGESLPTGEQEPNGVWKVIKGATKIPLKMQARNATGKLELPSPPPDRKPVVLLQLESINEAGAVAVSQPIKYRITQEGMQTANDAIPLATFQQNLATHSGQVVAVRGKLSPGSIQKGAIFELQVSDESNTPANGLIFLTDREITTELNELPQTETVPDARLTLRVGKKGTNGTTPVRITRIDFIGQGNRLVKTIPSSEEPADKLIAMNRKPEKFVGQTIVFLGYLSPITLGSEKAPELSIVTILGKKRPENIHFTSPDSIVSQLKGPGYSNEAIYAAQFTARVEPRVMDGTGAQIVTVTKIEFVDKEGNPGKTLE
jgi:predicted Zn finger-like uncharacterized protein